MMLSIVHRIYDSFVISKICLYVLASESLLLIVLFAIHCLNALIDVTTAPYRLRQKARFERAIERVLLESVYDNADQPWAIPEHYWFEKTALRDILFAYLIELKGDAKARLFRLYEALGFFSLDVKKLSSKRWWDRLSGATRLQHIGLDESEQALAQLFGDPHPFVANVINRHFDKMERQ